MAPVTFCGVCTYCGIILCLLTVLLVEKVNSSATCQEKYLDGQTPDTKHIVTVGEKITLRCDLSAVNETTDVVYWKNDEAVMSEDGGVIPKFQSKFNVSYGKNAKGILLYTISWIAELDDAGSYNCTCSTGGIRFRVWIRRPCNTVDNVLSNGTSVEVLDFLSNNTRVKDVAYKDSFNFSIALDCNCTWPEVNRTFNGVWYTNDTDTASVCGSGCTEIEDVQMANITGYQDTSLTPIGCYTGKGSVTYRYRNVFGSIHPNITCTPEMMNRVYNFYINEAQSTKQRTLMKIRCGGCTNDSSVSATSYVCMITGPIMGCCLVGMIILIVILRCWDKIDCCCITQETCPAPDPKKIATAAVKKVLIAKIVFGICLGTGAVCLIALLVQSVSDSNCKIPSSRACACAKCECALPQSDLIAASCVGVLTGGVIIVSSIFLAKVFLPTGHLSCSVRKTRQVLPREPADPKRISQKVGPHLQILLSLTRKSIHALKIKKNHRLKMRLTPKQLHAKRSRARFGTDKTRLIQCHLVTTM
ncbi:uncharacterized protein LOC135502040 isoform X2 [Lineus longissimus]|uniref:uncharacterized protein LOC135502040 isoform X2 n=1 Tax=Lineus longissimus TaxID=88925 RepID=UPI00315DC17C